MENKFRLLLAILNDVAGDVWDRLSTVRRCGAQTAKKIILTSKHDMGALEGGKQQGAIIKSDISC